MPRPLLAASPIHRRDGIVLVVILLVAAITRMGDLGRVTDYGYDQATLSTLALDFVSGKNVPVVGVESSAGVPNSPVTAYVLALPFALTDNPQLVALAIAAFNVVGVGLLWLLAHRYFSPRVAWIAGLAYALHPHAIFYSRSIWAQDTHTPLLLAGLLLSLYGYVERRRWAQLLALPVLVIGMQIHYAAWVMLLPFGWIVLRSWRRIWWPALIGSVILAALTLMPFALGLAANPSGGASAMIAHLSDLILRNKALLYLARLATGLGGPWVGSELVGEYDVVLLFPTMIAALWLIVGGLVIAGLAVTWRRFGVFRSVLLVLWAIAPFLIFVPNWTGVYPHYFVPMLPALSLLVGIGADGLLGALPKPARVPVAAAIVAVLLTQGATFLLFLHEADTTNTPLYPTPIHHLLDVRDALRTERDVVISGGVSKSSGYDIWHALLYRSATCVRELVIASGGIALFPAHPFAVISPPGALAPAAGDLYDDAPAQTIALRPGEGAYTLRHFDTAPAWNGPALTDVPPVRFDNGVSLTGYRLGGDSAYLSWTLPAAIDHDYQYFVHFLDATGEKIGQQDASFYPSTYWCAGDRVVTWIGATAPVNTATLRVGMYIHEGDTFTNANVVDAAGNALGPWADVALPSP